MYKNCFLLLFVLIINSQNYCFADYSDFIWSKMEKNPGGRIGKTNDKLFSVVGGLLTTPMITSEDNGITWVPFFEDINGPLPAFSNIRIVNKKNSKGIFLYCLKFIDNIHYIVYTDFETQGQLKIYSLDFPINAFDCDANHNGVVILMDSSVYFSNDSMSSWKKIFKDDVFNPVKIFIHDENNIGFIAEKIVAERRFEHKYFYTIDAGNTWQDVDLTFSRGYNIRLGNLEFITDKVGYINAWDRFTIPLIQPI